MTATVNEVQPIAAGIRFPVASRPMRRFSNTQTVSNQTGATSLQPIQLPATGFVRSIALLFTVQMTCGSAGAVIAGDAPFNVVSGITLTDATGQNITQPISAYNLYLINKYMPRDDSKFYSICDPIVSPEYEYSATATTGKAVFRLELQLEQDADTGYGCIPNLDANASLQMKIDIAPIGQAFAGTGVTSANVSVRIEQDYWAQVGAMTGNAPNQVTPPGLGDYLETRYETQTVSALTENTIPVQSKGGLTKGLILVSRNGGARTAFSAGANVGLVYDNNAIIEGIPLESHLDQLRRATGYAGPAPTTYARAANTAAPLSGIDTGVLPILFSPKGGERDTWLSTRVGTLLQVKATPGTAATQLEIVSQLMQISDAAAFYDKF